MSFDQPLTMDGEPSDAQYLRKPPKEMRTVRRDGDLIMEDHERLNPDGTVTKTITTTDERTGQKSVSYYRMDKSGIVRKLSEADHKQDLIDQLSNQIEETKEKMQALKEYNDDKESKSVAYETGPYYKDGIAYTKRVEEESPDKYQMAYDVRNVGKPIQMTPKQRAMMDEHKENILNFATQKLIKKFNKKMSDSKFNETYKLTDQQKDKVIEYGIRKLRKLMEKDLNEERLACDLMSFCPEFGKVDLSGRGTIAVPGSQSLSFKINPYEDLRPEDIAKPVSFSMRPEKPSKALPEHEPRADERVTNGGYKTIWERLMDPEAILEKVDDLKNKDYSKEDSENDSDSYQNSNGNNPKDFKNLRNTVKKILAEDEIYKKSALTPEQKNGIVDYALQQIRSVFKNTVPGEDGKKEIAKRKKKINLLEYFDEDEIFDYGKRVLRKLVRRSLKWFDIDQDILKKDKLEDPELLRRRDAFYQYLGDVVEGRVKESDPLPIIYKKNEIEEEKEEEPEPEEENKWNYKSILSSIFGGKGKDKVKKSEEKPKEDKDKTDNLDLDSILSWLLPDEKEKSEDKKVEAQPRENVEKVQRVKPHFYQLDPERKVEKEDGKSQSENTSFDLKSLLKKIQEAAVKKFSDPKPTKNNENQNEVPNQHQGYPPGNANNQISQEKNSDASHSGIKQNNEISNSRRVLNKPPYLKERISGLNTIPRPKVISVSPYTRNSDFSDQVSFQLKPQNYDGNQETSRQLENQRVDAAKPCSHEQDFEPWWFESPDSFVKKTFAEKPVLKEGFTPLVNSSFSSGRNGFSAGGSFSSDNLLE